MNSRRARILHVINSLDTGGAERTLLNLLSGGLEKKFENFVVSLADQGSFGPLIQQLDVPVFGLEMGANYLSCRKLSLLRRVACDFRPDLLQGWMYHGNLAAWAASRFAVREAALVWNIRHSLYRLRSEKPLTRHVIRANKLLSYVPGAVIYNSEVSRRQHEEFGFSRSNGRIIPNGFDLKRLRPHASVRAMLRKALGISEEAIVVGHIGRFHPMKDHESFLRAAVEVAFRHHQTQFLLCGRGVVAANQALAQLIPVVLKHRFRLLGERTDVYDLLKCMDVYCQSSSWGEAFPNALGEAMATGVACVATDVGDSAILVGSAGLIVPPGNAAALIVGLDSLVSKSGSQRKVIGESAMARVNERYSLENVVAEYGSLYELLLREKNR